VTDRRSLRRAAILSGVFAMIAPGTALVLLPWLVARWFPDPSVTGPWRLAGLLLILPGAVIVVDSFVRFVRQGRGSPAPVAPPDRLVVSGLYRYVRNPMYVGILAIVIGEALLWGRLALLPYAAVLWLAFHLFVTLYEEPVLRRRFGASYDTYQRSVPRWIPRLTPAPAEHPVTPIH
jgi:protein-S-isoprenylcysteine O-methyltransferase Ste14